MIDFTDYQIATRDTAVYPEAGTGKWSAVSYVGLGLGEVGEIQGKLKKVVRDDGGVVTEDKRSEIEKEMGDALWYLARLADELDLSLAKIAEKNLEKLFSRKERGVIGGSGDNR